MRAEHPSYFDRPRLLIFHPPGRVFRRRSAPVEASVAAIDDTVSLRNPSGHLMIEVDTTHRFGRGEPVEVIFDETTWSATVVDVCGNPLTDDLRCGLLVEGVRLSPAHELHRLMTAHDAEPPPSSIELESA